MPEILTTAFTTETLAPSGTPPGVGYPEFSLGQVPAPTDIAMTVAMTQKPRQSKKVKPADGSYDPAFPIPAKEDTQHASEVFEHYRNSGEKPDHINAHPALTEVDNPQDQPPMTLLEALGKPMIAAMTENPDGPAEDPEAASKFYEFPEESEKNKNAKPAMTDVPSRDDQERQQGKGHRTPPTELRLGERTSRLKERLLAALGGVGVRPTLAC